MTARIVFYRQARKKVSPPCNFYDPHVFFAEQHFEIYPNEEVLLVVNGSGYNYHDDSIHQLQFTSEEQEDDIQPTTLFSLSSNNQHLCVFVKNYSNDQTIYVSQKTPLTWVLNMSCIVAKLCFCSYAEVTKIKLQHLPSVTASKKADHKTILIQ